VLTVLFPKTLEADIERASTRHLAYRNRYRVTFAAKQTNAQASSKALVSTVAQNGSNGSLTWHQTPWYT